MNRRQFTASLAALFAAPALPALPRAAAAAAPAVPPGAYAWAQLIARSQNTCSPDMLARLLHLRPEVAQVLFKDMVVDGVLRAPGTTGIARAAQPFEATGLEERAKGRIRTKAKEMFDQVLSDEAPQEDSPLVKDSETGLGCAEPQAEDAADARTDQSPEESPERG